MANYYEKGLTEVVTNIINNIHDAMPEVDTKEGTFIRDVFIDPISDEITAMYGDMQLLKLSQSVLSAVGDDLDFLAANYFISRKSATKSSGKIRFYIKNTDKAISQLKDSDLPNELSIPIGTIVSTLSSYTTDAIQFQTTESIYKTKDGLKQLSIDGDTGFRFIEVPAESIEAGASMNVGQGEIVQQISNTNSAIAFIANPYAFSGGTDYESDVDLTKRIRLAITGSNIGTKDGYLSYILAQTGIVDAKVIGAGDNIMFRDGGYIRPDGKYQIGKGGMVDIYIRGKQNFEKDWDFTVTNDYMYGSKPYSNIVLPTQPVNEIVSITSSKTGITFINADEYEIEKYTIKDAADSTKTTVEVKYCKDILWDFSITDTFPDTMYYPLPTDLTVEQIKKLKADVDAELNDALNYMSDLIYSLDWATVETRSTEGGSTALFNKLYHNNQVFKIVAKDDTILNGRMFVLKNDKIYIRAYGTPDYILQKDVTPEAGSINGSDSIKWLNTEKIILDDVLTIKYNYDYLILSLQNGIEAKRCLTADVLLKQAIEIPIEIIVDITCYPYVTISELKKTISDNIIYWLDELQTLGGYFDESDVVALIKETDDVDSVNLDTIQIAVKGYSPQRKISCADNEYFKTSNIILNIVYNNQTIM